MTTSNLPAKRPALGDSFEMSPEDFRTAGHRVIDELADFFGAIGQRKITPGETARQVRGLFADRNLPAQGQPAAELLEQWLPLLIEHSLHNGHPRFFGYITSSADPLGALADLIAAAINQNCGLRNLSPIANEIEMQAVDWLAELIGYPRPCGGIMVSGGNMANMLAFLAARHARLPWNVRRDGFSAHQGRPMVYASRETHTWIQKAADISGVGTRAIRWVPTDAEQRVRVDELDSLISHDLRAGEQPFLVVATAGNVSTGAVDPLADVAAVAARHGLWFHVDGAYGAPAAALPEASDDLKALSLADSIALDPHKWLYSPIEAACTLVRDPEALRAAFSYRPDYYLLDDDVDRGGVDYYEHGLQNSRGFRALKVWLCLRRAGRAGYEQRIRRDIELAGRLHELVGAEPELEVGTWHLSITTFRFRPLDCDPGSAPWCEYLNQLNGRLIAELQKGGLVYVSNAVRDGRLFLRACIVNFRTTPGDIDALKQAVVEVGRALDQRLRPPALAAG